MLSGVLFRRTGEKGAQIEPEFVNQYILTDVYLASKSLQWLKTPILPSIATLVNPLTSLILVTLAVFRAMILVLLTHLPGSRYAIKKISVANTAILFHDGRALATCESGPPMRILLPGLETVGWFNGRKAEGEIGGDDKAGYGGTGMLSFMKEWTTGHVCIRIIKHGQPTLMFYSLESIQTLPNSSLSTRLSHLHTFIIPSSLKPLKDQKPWSQSHSPASTLLFLVCRAAR